MRRTLITKLVSGICILSLLLCGCSVLPQSGVPNSGASRPSTEQSSSPGVEKSSKPESEASSPDNPPPSQGADKGETQAASSEVSQPPSSTAKASETQVASSQAGGGFKRPDFAETVFNKDKAEQVGNEVSIDFSSLSKGYVGVSCVNGKRLRFRVVYGDKTQTYELRGDGVPECYPLQSGNGDYTFIVLQNTTGESYMRLFEKTVSVTLDNEFEPFIRPSQMVKYSKDSNTTKLANKLGEAAKNEEALVASVYDYIKSNIKYDYEKAKKAAAGQIPTYLPNPDDILATNNGICFDYAAIAAAMLRSQGIPTKMLTGYVQNGQVYHAWNMIYLKETGWITVEIKAPAKTWYTIDLTFAANGADTTFIGSGEGYVQRFVY